MTSLSIIIINWNTRRLLDQCLQSIYDTQADLELEVVVVDNASVDGSSAMVQAKYPAVHLIENSDNLGFAAANNQGLAVAQGKHMLLLNSDTIVLSNALQTMVEFAERQPDAGFMGLKLLNEDRSLQPSWASFPSLTSEVLGKNFRDRTPVADQPNVFEVDSVSGACLMVRAEVYDQVGGLDEDYFMYSEEIDWCYRIRHHGWRGYYLTGAEIIHLGGGSASRNSLLQLSRLYESKILFFMKHYGSFAATLLKYGLVLANSFGLARRVAAWPLRKLKGTAGNVDLSVRWQLIWHLLRHHQPSSLS